MKAKIFFTSLLMAFFFLASLSYAGVKNTGWQGRVVDSGTGHPLHGNYTIIYSIYPSASGGSPLWTETQSTFIDSGIAEVLMGSVTPIPDSVFNGSVRFLGVKVGSDPEMTPRSEMVSVPYASYAFAGGGWKHNGTAVTLATSTDSVGIGTSDPQYKLDVNGDVHFSDFLDIGDSSLWLRGKQHRLGSTNNFRVIIDSDNNQTDRIFSVHKDESKYGNPSWGPELFRIQENGNVGIGTTTPNSRLHVQNSTLAANETAVQVGFGSAVDLVTGKGIVAESDLMTIKGARIGVIGKSTVNVSGNQGSAEGRMGQVVGYDANGVMDGVVGSSNPSALDNNGATNTSFAVGGSFAAQPPAGMTLNATGTYKVGGVLATVGGQVDAAGSNAIVAGVIGEDNATGTATSYAGYFTSNRTDSYDKTAVYARCYPQTGWGVGGDFSGGYEGVRGYSDHIGVQGDVANGPAGTECYGGLFQANGQSVTSIPYGVYGMANGTTGSTCYGVYGGASGSGPNIWAGYFNGRLYAQGNVGIGTTTPTEKLNVWWGTNVDAELGRGTTDTDITYLALRNASGTKCYIYPNSAGNGIVVSTTKP